MSRNRYDRKPSRRAEAEQRQADYDALSTEEKIARAKSRRGNSKSELARLEVSNESA